MTRAKRKDEHVALALSQHAIDNDYQNVKIIHQSLPPCDLKDVSTETHLFGVKTAFPIYINAMTGGSLKTLDINRKLATVAKTFGLMMAVGSQHVALDDPQYEASFRVVRETNPQGFIIGNVSANATVEEAQRAIAMIDANALGIHINVAQELTMDEGDREFSHWTSQIAAIVKNVDVPVIVKEVGFGMSQKTIETLYQLGVSHVDVSGHGGTNFIWIENERSEKKRYHYLLDWGITPVESLLMNQAHQKQLEIVASGGVKTPLDAFKLMALGAKGVGVSGLFLKATQLEHDVMITEVRDFLQDFKKVMLMSGCQSIEDISHVEYQLKGHLMRYES